MKILFGIDEYDVLSEGGSKVVVERLAHELAKKHEVAIITTHRHGKEYVKKRVNHIPIYSIKVAYPLQFRAYFSLYNPPVNRLFNKVLEDFHPDIYHAHTIHTYLTYYSLLIAKKYGCKVIFTAHDVMPVFYGRLTQFIDKDGDGILDTLDYRFHFFKEWWKNKLAFNPFRNQLIKKILNQIAVVTVSKALKDVLTYNGLGVQAVIHNGINPALWFASKTEVDQFMGRHQLRDKKTLLINGRLRPDKGSLQAVHILKNLPENYVLLIAGDNGGAGEMFRVAEVLHLTHRLLYLGQLKQDQMRVVYHASDVVLVPSMCFDSLPNAVLEGMAAGKPVIASCFGGAKEVLSPTSLLINPFKLSDSSITIMSAMDRPKSSQRQAFFINTVYQVKEYSKLILS